MLTITRPLVVLDLETTGLEISKDRIVEVAAVKYTPDQDGRPHDPALFSTLINPGRPLSPEIEELTGIRSADLIGRPIFATIAPGLLAFLRGCDLGGFGVLDFDIPLLAEEFIRAGLEFDLAGVNVIDAMSVYKKMEPRNLANAVRFYVGGEMEGAHRAEADASAAAAVILAQANRYPEMNRPQDFAYFARNGKRLDPAGYIAEDDNGEALFTFGKNKGQKVQDCWDYSRWMLGADFPEATKRALRRQFPQVYKVAPPPAPEPDPQQALL